MTTPSFPQDNSGHDTLFLGGFQVFDELVSIPFSKLTLMFGPNSAGKSAVSRALDLLSELLKTDSPRLNTSQGDAAVLMSAFTPPNFGLPDMSSVWRKISGSPNRYSNKMTIGVKRNVAVNSDLRTHVIDSLYLSSNLRSSNERKRQTLELTFVHRRIESAQAEHELHFIQDIYLTVDDEPLIQTNEDDYVGLNLAHPQIDGLMTQNDLDALLHVKHFPDAAVLADGWLCVRGRSQVRNMYLQRHMMFCRCPTEESTPWHGLQWDNGSPPGYSDKDFAHSTDARTRDAFHRFADVVDSALVFAAEALSIRSEVAVEASRTVPHDRELVFLIPPGSDVTPSNSLDGYYLSNFGQTGYFRNLAESLLPHSENIVEDDDNYDNDARIGPGFALKVNQALSNHLFLDSGYQVAVDSRVILDLEQFANQFGPDQTETVRYPMLVRLLLIDSARRKHSFDDVGSGIGYVLPVICATCGDSANLSFIEQPELHLHPALQSALGDVFVEAMNEGRHLVIETHSEHVLLRILKRIRQTNSDRPPVPDLRISPDEISILYFDPRPDGATQVKHLRVTSDGEFLDLWPRGFFEERYQDLFDE